MKNTAIIVAEETLVVETVVEPVYETVVEKNSVAVLFGFNSSELSSAAKAKLDEIIRISQHNDSDVVMLNGQSDNQGNAAYNMKLSKLRVQHVEEYLESHGLEVQQLEQSASGEDNAHANTIEERALERRVIVTLTSEVQQLVGA